MYFVVMWKCLSIFSSSQPSHDVNVEVTQLSKWRTILTATGELSSAVQHFLNAKGQVVVMSQETAGLPGLLLGAY